MRALFPPMIDYTEIPLVFFASCPPELPAPDPYGFLKPWFRMLSTFLNRSSHCSTVFSSSFATTVKLPYCK